MTMTSEHMPASPTRRSFEPASDSRVLRRVLGIVFFVIALAPLVIAAFLKPDAAGHSTHLQLGLKPCGLLERTGIPCPTCGMTTSFAHAANGNLLQSIVTQPGGAALALALAMTSIVAGYVAITGANLTPWLRPFFNKALIWGIVLFFLAAWIYKIAITVGA